MQSTLRKTAQFMTEKVATIRLHFEKKAFPCIGKKRSGPSRKWSREEKRNLQMVVKEKVGFTSDVPWRGGDWAMDSNATSRLTKKHAGDRSQGISIEKVERSLHFQEPPRSQAPEKRRDPESKKSSKKGYGNQHPIYRPKQRRKFLGAKPENGRTVSILHEPRETRVIEKKVVEREGAHSLRVFSVGERFKSINKNT